jgi:hypothetical protein
LLPLPLSTSGSSYAAEQTGAVGGGESNMIAGRRCQQRRAVVTPLPVGFNSKRLLERSEQFLRCAI